MRSHCHPSPSPLLSRSLALTHCLALLSLPCPGSRSSSFLARPSSHHTLSLRYPSHLCSSTHTHARFLASFAHTRAHTSDQVGRPRCRRFPQSACSALTPPLYIPDRCVIRPSPSQCAHRNSYSWSSCGRQRIRTGTVSGLCPSHPFPPWPTLCVLPCAPVVLFLLL